MKVVKTLFDSVLVIEPKIWCDARGFFYESYSKAAFEALGITTEFVQDNHSRSIGKTVVRGIHLQKAPFAQAKLVRCTRGRMWDVVVDLRADSPTFGQWEGVELSEDNALMLFIPAGFGHGFKSLTDDVEVLYKVDRPYHPASEVTIRWNDPTIGIEWGIEEPVLSAKDANAKTLNEQWLQLKGETQ